MSLWRLVNTCIPWRLRMLSVRKRRATLSDLAIALFCLFALSACVMLTSLSPLGMMSDGYLNARRLPLSREEALQRRWWAWQEIQERKRWKTSATQAQFDAHPKRIESYIKNGTFRPSRCSNCTHFSEAFLVHPSACSGETTAGDQALQLLVLVSSAPSAREKRIAIRQTWGSASQSPGSGVQVAFVLGRWDEEEGGNERIVDESEVHRDILFVDFLDTYMNLTMKTMAGLRWASRYCPQARNVLKCDDDVWVNVEELTKKLRYHDGGAILAGYCVEGKPPDRDPRSKWYASFLSHPSGQYPAFCFGPGYLLSRAALAGVLAASPNVPFFHLEDVYTAMCAHQAAVRVTRLDGFFNRPLETDACTHRSSRILLAHDYSPQLLRDIWTARCLRRIVARPPPPVPGIDRHQALRQRALLRSSQYPSAKARPGVIITRRGLRLRKRRPPRRGLKVQSRH